MNSYSKTQETRNLGGALMSLGGVLLIMGGIAMFGYVNIITAIPVMLGLDPVVIVVFGGMLCFLGFIVYLSAPTNSNKK